MPLVSPPTTPPNPTQLQHENGSSLGKFITKANLLRNVFPSNNIDLPSKDVNSQKIDRDWHFLVFLGSFENDTPVVTKPLLEGLNPKSCPKSPSETDLLLYLGIHFDQYSLFLFQKKYWLKLEPIELLVTLWYLVWKV